MVDTCILILSCDDYSDLWQPFFTLFWQYWPDHSFKVYLGSNLLVYNDPRVKTIPVGEDNNWSNGLLKILELIDTPHVILILEDFFFRRPVNTNHVLRCIRALRELDGRMLRLIPRPRPDRPVPGYPFLGYIKPTSPYRVSTQGTLWKKSALISLIGDGENIWEFELKGTERSRGDKEGYYSVWKPVLTYHHHVVEKGKWFRSAARRFGAMNIGCDFSVRPVMSMQETFLWHMNKFLAYPKSSVPWVFRQKVKQYIKRL